MLHDSLYLKLSKEDEHILFETYFRLYYPTIYYGDLPDIVSRNNNELIKKNQLEYNELLGRQTLINRADNLILNGKINNQIFSKNHRFLTQGSIL